ncbi:hypothetical protein E3N88_21922 [Mikania micrantha]|uniref:EF-hand domain-containing protein n=1 Tax=Mikania micrantha TaxID=192012 RepID=A0A5N6N8Z8_9ASTR|nr:hypothetical protein E3N88_21922 [Mikania micrantha]
MFDQDGDGKITINELSKSLERIGMVIPEKDLQQMIDHMDSNGDGSINMEQFERLYETIITEERDEEEEMREAFNVFDQNGDGFITVEELRSVLTLLGFRQGQSIKDCRLMIKKVDKDGDGMVNYKEFREMMRGGGFGAISNSLTYHDHYKLSG